MQPIDIREKDNVLIVAPHPDDECIAMGGFMVRYHEQCEVWLISDGSHGGDRKQRSRIVDIRWKEFENEMNFLGIRNYKRFNLVDGALSNYLELFGKVNLSKFSKVFVPNRNDAHMDHVSVFLMFAYAIKNQGLSQCKLYQYEVTQPLMKPTNFLDITDYIEKKRAAILLHRSQILQYDYCDIAISLNSFRASCMGLFQSYIEVYEEFDVFNQWNGDSEAGISLRQDLQRANRELKFNVAWLEQKINQKSIVNYITEKKIRRVAIYGYGRYGRLLEREFESLNCEIVVFIDRFKGNQNKYTELGYKIVMEKGRKDDVDCIIVSVLHNSDSIKRELMANGYDNVITLEEIIYSI